MKYIMLPNTKNEIELKIQKIKMKLVVTGHVTISIKI